MAIRGFSITLHGVDTLVDVFNTVSTARFMEGVSAGVYDESIKIMNKSKRQVPLEDGILRSSATVNQPVTSGQLFSITMGYGGDASAYALIQHENLSFHHPGLHSKRKDQSGRKGKYLEDPVNESLPTLEARIAKSVLAYFIVNGL